MAADFDSMLPELKEFTIPDTPFKVVDPTGLPDDTRKAFDDFLAGSTLPQAFCAYSHDYSQFCKMVRNGDINIG
ncbi:hypothetical protein C9J03_14820 [Photobacterium gaetbulicola]|uniref:Uncharacterized protein n=2 Tax=Vibrionaceae TaxID=641 RepID=A0A0C5WJ07_9GAMM|nr:hypothetical protein H744_1c0120 [Photobacterium gaetbulicola Gung47]PSU06935.1 hypothetical protein C9J03_14820 [Photobacterium gaetbulicola]